MKTCLMIFVVLMSLMLCAVGTAMAAGIALTSIGQSSDVIIVKAMLSRAGIPTLYDAQMNADELKDEHLLIVVLGGSFKGLQASGVNQDEEEKRGLALINGAKYMNIHVLAIFMGGQARRGKMTDGFIKAVVPLCDTLLVLQSGNTDLFFQQVKKADTTLVEAKNMQDMASLLEASCGVWVKSGK